MRGRVDFAEGDAAVGVAGGRIEHAQPEAGAEEAMQGGVDIRFADEVLVDGVDQRWEGLALHRSRIRGRCRL